MKMQGARIKIPEQVAAWHVLSRAGIPWFELQVKTFFGSQARAGRAAQHREEGFSRGQLHWEDPKEDNQEESDHAGELYDFTFNDEEEEYSPELLDASAKEEDVHTAGVLPDCGSCSTVPRATEARRRQGKSQGKGKPSGGKGNGTGKDTGSENMSINIHATQNSSSGLSVRAPSGSEASGSAQEHRSVFSVLLFVFWSGAAFLLFLWSDAAFTFLLMGDATVSRSSIWWCCFKRQLHEESPTPTPHGNENTRI